MGFRDDVVIRVSAAGAGTRVDMRSASRYGLSDFGANAARIRSLLDDIDDAVGVGAGAARRSRRRSAAEPKRPSKRSGQAAKR